MSDGSRRAARWVIGLGQLALVVGLGLGIAGRWFPLGVPGEWEWSRVPYPADVLGVVLAGAAVVVYAGVAALGMRLLERSRPGRLAEGLAVAGLVTAAVAVQVVVPSGAPIGYGLTKWVTLAMTGSSGYQTVARREVDDPWRFWAAYPTWIRDQDALHIGTHPPSLILGAHAARRVMERNPRLAERVVGLAPETVTRGFRDIVGPMPLADRAAIVLTGALTLLACAATVAPLYLLARASLPAGSAWAAACLWPLVPSAILFQPAADTAFPLLATSALALASWSLRRGLAGFAAALVAGALLAVGMQVTLAFLAVGLVVALVLAGAAAPGENAADRPRWADRLVLVVVVGLGFLGVTGALWAVSGANPFVIWWWNQANHARFYVEYPRSYLSWVLVNPIELAVGLGLPTVLWALVGLAGGRRAPAVAWGTVATMAILTLGGRNLSEVARLWLPLMPALLVVAAAGMRRLAAGWADLAVTLALLGAQTLLLQATIQVVYPV